MVWTYVHLFLYGRGEGASVIVMGEGIASDLGPDTVIPLLWFQRRKCGLGEQ